MDKDEDMMWEVEKNNDRKWKRNGNGKRDRN